jgi:molybdopterin biosynthesis enzyme MoaB
MCATMAENAGKDMKKGDNFTVGALFLPPDGWSVQEYFVRSLEMSWKSVGNFHLRATRLGNDPGGLVKTMRRWTDRDSLAVVATVGRSGPGAGDFVPDVTRELLQRHLPGIEERMYLASPRRPEDLLFRGAAGIRKGTIIVNFPSRRGRIKTVLDFLRPVLRHAVEKVAGDESECAR